MRLALLLCGSVLAAAVAASPNSYTLHEKRDRVPGGWRWKKTLDSNAVVPMRIALAQSNLDKTHAHLMDVSHPESANFGKHWTAKQVADTFAPSDETVAAVTEWLETSGIAPDRVTRSKSRGWLSFDATVAEAENLLQTKYHVYEHESGQPHVVCDQYSLPSNITKFVDFVLPSVSFDVKLKPRQERPRHKPKARRHIPGNAKSIGKSGSRASTGFIPKLAYPLNKNDIIKELERCDEQTVPNCLRALYKFPPNNRSNPKNSYGIVEFVDLAYLPDDLDMFFRNFSPSQVGNRPIFKSIDGGVLQTQNQTFSLNAEPSLDLSYAMTLVYPQNVGDLITGGSFNNLLDALDGSFCTYKGGDDPVTDGVYPSPEEGGYKSQDCGIYNATNVISLSYGNNEADLSPFYMRRQCEEYAKLGLMGVSIIYSSGDRGVAGNEGQCLYANGTLNDGTSGRFAPGFPTSCPYVTSVGGTQVINGTNIVKSLAAGIEPEQACEFKFRSGGGFSDIFTIPDYQVDAVGSWFKNYPPPYGADRFNNTGKARGFPDVSANGSKYVIYVNGGVRIVSGTSASAPVFGSILTLLNQARLDAGKSTVGFINPTIYAHPHVFNDITKGANSGCGTPGFQSAPGWDPVTGLGTPNYPKLLELYLSLP